MSTTSAERVVDAREVDNNRKSFTDLRAEIIDESVGRAMTSHYNGNHWAAATCFIDAATAAANDRRVVSALIAIAKVIDEEAEPVQHDELVALEDLLDRARCLADDAEVSS